MLPETVRQVMHPSFGSRLVPPLATFPFTIVEPELSSAPDLRISHQCAAIVYVDARLSKLGFEIGK